MLRAASRVIRADLAARPLQAVLTGVVIAIAAIGSRPIPDHSE